MSTQAPQAVVTRVGKKTRIAVAAARFNADLTDELLAGCLRRLGELGVADDHVEVVRVPGAFELPVTAKAFARTGRFDAVVCLGCVVRGETPHFEYIASAVANGITSAAAASGVPMAFGVLTTNSIEEAIERAGEGTSNKGWEAAVAAIEMVSVVAQLTSRDVSAAGR